MQQIAETEDSLHSPVPSVTSDTMDQDVRIRNCSGEINYLDIWYDSLTSNWTITQLLPTQVNTVQK
jgi:hypothetical protein